MKKLLPKDQAKLRREGTEAARTPRAWEKEAGTTPRGKGTGEGGVARAQRHSE